MVKYRVNRGQEFVIGGYTAGNPFDALIVGYYEGEKLLYAAKVRNGFRTAGSPRSGEQVQGLTDPRLSLCQSARVESNAMGFDQVRDEKLCVAQAAARRTDPFHRMDVGGSPETFKVERG